MQRLLKIARFAAGDLAWKVANIVLLAVASRVLAPADAALIVLSQTASLIFLSLGDLGYRAIGIRLVARSSNGAQAIWRAVNIRRLAAMVLLGAPGGLLCAWVLADDLDAAAALALMVFAYAPHFLSADWVLLALGKTGYVALARLVYAVILLSLCAGAFLSDVSLAYFASAVLLGYFAFALFSAAAARRSIEKHNPASLDQETRDELGISTSFVLALSFGLNTAFHSLEILMAGALLGETLSAVYAAPFRLIFSAYAVGWMLTQYLSPQFARLANDDTLSIARYVSLFVLYGSIVAFAFVIAADWLIHLVYGSAFPGAGEILRWLAPTLVLDAIVACLGTIIVMQNNGKASAYSIGAGCVASTFVFLLLLEYDVWAAVGAKYAAYCTLLLFQCVWFVRRMRLKEG